MIISVEGTGYYTQSAECVGPHPDNLADTISDTVLQAHLEEDPLAHVAAETVCSSDGSVTLSGEITSIHVLTHGKYVNMTRQAISDYGWGNPNWEYYGPRVPVIVRYKGQSEDIAVGVEPDLLERDRAEGGKKKTIGAGDQGIVVGYAEDRGIKVAHFMPVPLVLARDILWRVNRIRRDEYPDAIKPDMKSGVVVEYKSERPVKILHMFAAIAHAQGVGSEDIRRWTRDGIEEVLDGYRLPYDWEDFIVNNTGIFEISGPPGDTGLTGRKGPIDTFGQFVSYGGGALSGKDPTKVDRTGVIDLRWLTKNIVANGLAGRCKATATYVIGAQKPLVLALDFFGTEQVAIEQIIQLVQAVDFSVAASIERHNLRYGAQDSQIYWPDLAANGHFGGHFDNSQDRSLRPWETIVDPNDWAYWQFGDAS